MGTSDIIGTNSRFYHVERAELPSLPTASLGVSLLLGEPLSLKSTKSDLAPLVQDAAAQTKPTSRPVVAVVLTILTVQLLVRYWLSHQQQNILSCQHYTHTCDKTVMQLLHCPLSVCDLFQPRSLADFVIEWASMVNPLFRENMCDS